MMHHLTIAAIVIAATAIVSVSAIIAQSVQAQQTPFEINSAISEDRIVITIVRSSAAQELPEGPIVIVPPNVTEGEDNATVILPPPSNETGEQPPQNITIIEPDGEIQQLPAGNITTTPGNVTVIDPPACGCPPVGEAEAQPGEPTQLPILPGNNVSSAEPGIPTQLPAAPPAPVQLPAEGGNGGNGDGGNGNGNGNGDDGGG